MSTKPTGKRPTKVSAPIKELLSESVKDDLIITHKYNEFITDWPSETYSRAAVLKMMKLMLTPQRDRKHSWSASGAGKPLRHQELQFLGIPPVGGYDPRLQRIFHNGTWAHMRMQATFLTAGLIDDIEVTNKVKSLRSRCSMDGYGVAKDGRYEGSPFGLEIKSRNEWAYNTQVIKGVDTDTRLQVDFMFMITGLDLFVVLNENKNNQDIKEWVYVRDSDRVKEIRKQVDELNRAIDIRRLHPVPDACKKRNNECPWGGAKGVCGNIGRWPSKIPR